MYDSELRMVEGRCYSITVVDASVVGNLREFNDKL